ncbi:excinuclease ABC subunit UvrA [Halomonadaceae bacterium KBTZ08]
MNHIRIRGARTHNLASVDLDIPRNELVVVTGLSGSGKSSLAFDTLYAEGQRRYVESLSTYARQFLSMMEKPDVDHIEGLSPAISIEQKSTSHNPRSTVGTITEIHDYLRLLFARAGEPRCPVHDEPLAAQTVSQMVDQVLTLPEGSRMMILAPLISERKGEHQQVLDEMRSQGFIRLRIDGHVYDIDNLPSLDPKRKHSIEVVVDRFRIREGLQQRLAESFETALGLADDAARVASMDDDGPSELVFSARHACPQCRYSISAPEPRTFSFNNPAGACPTCDGLGLDQFFDPERLIRNPELTLAEGAIRGWDRRSVYYFQMLESVASHYGCDLDTPWEQLPDWFQRIVLHGTGEEPITFRYVNSRGEAVDRDHPFEGVIPNLERRYRETDSQTVRDEMARSLNSRPCPDCHGSRLNEVARHVFIGDWTLPAMARLSIAHAQESAHAITLPGWRGQIAETILNEIRKRLEFLVNVGLSYLTLERSADTLSGGEAQRIRLASQIGAGLVGVMYILDEPSIGLHQRDNDRLLNTLKRLRDMGNTVIVVEHDEDAIRAADHIVDIGPGAGIHGGRIIAEGTADAIAAEPESITGQYLTGQRRIPIPEPRHSPGNRWITLKGATGHNLQGDQVTIPIGLMTCVTGVSGSGKSTLINSTLYPAAARQLNNATSLAPEPHDAIEGLEGLDRVIDIDQSPIGRTPRSNPATYTGLFTPIRELFAGTQEARSRGYKPGRFSFNVKGGRCEACQGDGEIKVEMHFLPDIYVPCDVCQGQRYNRETLEITYKGKTIHDVLSMTIEEARDFFDSVPFLARRLQTLMEVGLSYVKLGQNAVTLSGGEAQRVKLARELSKRDTGNTLYILDEPTTGLHFQDIQQLLDVLHALRDHGNTVIVIEHNIDVIKTADWLVDLGPEGGDGGGRLVAQGLPETVAAVSDSHTGQYLAPILGIAHA